MKRQKIFTRAALASMVLVPATSVLPDAGWAQVQGNEIVVTARKRAENLQDVPVAITAFDNLELTNAGFDNILDVAKASPGLFVESFSSTPARVDTVPRFRGVVVDNSDPLLRTATVFIDGIYVAGGIQGIGVQELERVEIIKGPQSALFGRNTFAGAINYVTRDPGDEFRFDATMLAATRDEYRAAGSVEGPIVGDMLTGRVNASYVMNGGHYTNSADTSQELGEEQTWSISGTALFQPNERVRVKVRGHYYEDDDGPGAVQRVGGFAEHNFGGFPIVGGVADNSVPFMGAPTFAELRARTRTESAFKGTLSMPSLSQIGTSTTQAQYDTVLAAFNANPLAPMASFGRISLEDLGGFGLKRRAYRASLDASWDVNDYVTMDVLFGFNKEHIAVLSDGDETPDFGFSRFFSRDFQDLSTEVRFSGGLFDDRLNWTLGGSYLDLDINALLERYGSSALPC